MEFKIDILPPTINCETIAILKTLNTASRYLGELKGEVKKIPNSQILIDTLILLEAKDSNEVENIVTTHDELYKASVNKKATSRSAKEAQNYAATVKLGYKMVQEKKIISTNDIINLQSKIAPNHPVRKIPGTSLKNPTTGEIIYTPPQDFNEIQLLLDNLEQYINVPELHKVDALIKMPIIHYQFESIHPFYDGNGRTGRILNMLYLVQQELLDIPILYLSSYINKNKNQYYELLQNVRAKNDWESWIIWMLTGVAITAQDAIKTVNSIKLLMDTYKKEIKLNFSFYSHDLINTLFKHPYTKIDLIAKELNVHRNTASSYLNNLAKSGLLKKQKIGQTNYYINEPLFNILSKR